MGAHELVILWAARVALVATLAGLVARGRVRQCYSFVFYAGAVIVCGSLIALWPARFYTPEFWLVRQALYDIAKLLVALELAWRVLRAFPGAMRAAQRWAIVLLPITVALVAAPWSSSYHSFAAWQPRMTMGTVALLGITAGLTLWYNLPLRPWHRAMLLGFTGYLFTYNVLLEVLRQWGWQIVRVFNAIEGLTYLAVVVWWAVEAWRPDPVLEGISVTVQRRLGLLDAEGA